MEADRFASRVVLFAVCALNAAFAAAHQFEPSRELLVSLLVVGGFQQGRKIDRKRAAQEGSDA